MNVAPMIDQIISRYRIIEKPWWWWDGGGLQGGRYRPRPLRRTQIPARECGARPAGLGRFQLEAKAASALFGPPPDCMVLELPSFRRGLATSFTHRHDLRSLSNHDLYFSGTCVEALL